MKKELKAKRNKTRERKYARCSEVGNFVSLGGADAARAASREYNVYPRERERATSARNGAISYAPSASQ